MSRGFTGVMMKAFGAGEWVFTVTAIEDVTPHYRRITFHAPGYFDSTGFGPASYVRFWMPDPEDPERQHQRAYTVVSSDAATETLVIEVVFHTPSGPAAAWAARAKVGDQVATTKWGSPRFLVPVPAPAGYLLIGDPAGLPAINGVLSAIPQDVPVVVLLEFTHDDDPSLPMTPHPLAKVTWVRRTGAPGLLAASIPAGDYSDFYVWVTAETAATQAVRARLKEWGFPKSAIHAQGYWSQGKQMGKSRAEGEGRVTTEASAPSVETRADADTEAALPLADAAPPRARLDTPSVEAGSVQPAGTWRTQAGARLLEPLSGKLKVAGVVQALVSLLALSPFVLLAELCRRFLAGTASADALRTLGIAAAVLMVSGTLLSIGVLAALHVVDADFGRMLRGRMIDHLGRLPLGWFDQRSSGLVRKAVDDDATALHYLVTHAVLDLVAAIVTPLAVLIYLFIVEASLAGFLLLPLVVYYVLMMRMYSASVWAVPIFERWRARIAAESVAFLDGMAVTRTHDRGPTGRMARLLEERATFVSDWQRPLTAQKTTLESVTRPTTWLLMLTTIGGLFVIAGWTRPAELVPFLMLGVTFGAQLLAITYGFQAIRDANTAAREIGLVLTEPVLAADREGEGSIAPSSATPTTGKTVHFREVTFGYHARRPVLEDFELTLRPGTMTALVGPSGAGKSTVAALLARFHDVGAGAITIDDVDVRALSQADLYRSVGFAFQGTTLIEGTLHENIALGRPDATRAEVEEAAKRAQIHERITRLERGYDAVVGDDARLSGGESQRVAIARLLLANPPILVLDEATSFADPESEHLVQRALSELIRERTVLVIAHRLHTIAGADHIVVMGTRGIAEQGTHEELLLRGGAYASLWQAAGHLQEVGT